MLRKIKLAISGSRDFNDRDFIISHIRNFIADMEEECADEGGMYITEFIHGGCSGVDTIASEFFAEKNIPIRVFPADWELHGKAAGPIRN